MASIDDEWENFMLGKPDRINTYEDNEDEDNDEIIIPDIPQCRDLYISTKTKKPFLNIDDKIDILNLFWKIPVIEYWTPIEGIVKKQMKIVCKSELETAELEKRRTTEYYFKDKKIVKQTENTNRKTKYKDERKISVGLNTKDVMNCRGKEGGGAMYNCIALTIRFKNTKNIFIEIHVKIFNTGKLEIPGILDATLYERIKDFILKVLSHHFLPHVLDFRAPTSENVIINSNFYVGFNINRDVLHGILRSEKYKIDTIYDSCTYPAVKSKFYFCNALGFDPVLQRGTIQQEDRALKTKDIMISDKYTKVSFMVFRTGSCLIVGNCTEEVLMFVYEFVKKVLTDEYEKIYVEGGEETPESKKANKKTKLRKRKMMVTPDYFSNIKKIDE
jgi:hypothetical protein